MNIPSIRRVLREKQTGLHDSVSLRLTSVTPSSRKTVHFSRGITRANTNATHAFFLIIPDVPFPAKEFKPRSYFFTSLWRKGRDVMLHVNRDPIHLKRTSFTTRYPNAFRYRAVMPTSSRWQKGLTSSSSGTEKDWLMCSTTARRTIVSARAR